MWYMMAVSATTSCSGVMAKANDSYPSHRAMPRLSSRSFLFEPGVNMSSNGVRYEVVDERNYCLGKTQSLGHAIAMCHTMQFTHHHVHVFDLREKRIIHQCSRHEAVLIPF
jgi:hypothetical protein